VYLYSALFVVPHSQGSRAWITQCYLQITAMCRVSVKHYYIILYHACLYLVSIHQMVYPQTEVADI